MGAKNANFCMSMSPPPKILIASNLVLCSSVPLAYHAANKGMVMSLSYGEGGI